MDSCPLRHFTVRICRLRSCVCRSLSVSGGQRGIVLFQTAQLVFAPGTAMTRLVAPRPCGGLGSHCEQCTSLERRGFFPHSAAWVAVRRAEVLVLVVALSVRCG